jgi:AbrB family looped-hinge helix DNA binding protein
MTTLTITAKGQITLKKELLRHLGLGPGDQLDIDMIPGGRLTVAPAQPPRTGSMTDAFGMLHRPGQKALTIEEMNEIIARGWAGQLDL